MSRTANALRNIRYGLIGQLVGIVVSFVARMVFVRTLTVEHLGLNGLFANILTVLSVAELGIGSAIVFSMYEPLARGEKARLRSLMRLYRRAYTGIGVFVLLVGGALTPVLPVLVGELPSIPHVEVIYLLFVANAGLTYFFAYKRAFLIADQKRYIATAYRYCFFVVMNIMQIFVLVATRDFILFLVIQVVFTFAENVAVSRRVDAMYPYLREKPIDRLSSHDRDTISRNVGAMIFHRIGGAVTSGTDGVIISALVGVAAVGLYSNYVMITGALSVVLGVLFASLTAGVGNLGVEASVEKQRATFRALDLAVSWIFGVCSIGLLVLANPFIELWLGGEFVFDMPTVLALAASFYFTGVRNGIWVFKDAKGLFWPDRFRPLVEVVVKVGVSLWAGHYFGVLGVLAGTIVSTIVVCLPWEPRVLFGNGFARSSRSYYRSYLGYVAVAVSAGMLTWGICLWLPIVGFWGFLLKMAVCVTVPNVFYWCIFGRTEEFGRLVKVLRSRSGV